MVETQKTNVRQTAHPTLSVVMLVYNGEKYLRESIQSVLDQTFKDFELIIINDGSTDGSLEVIRSFEDPRIRLIDNQVNRGIPYSRNLGLKEARGDFLTWTDCDDINLPERFEKQLNFMENRPQFGVCGTWLARFEGDKVHYIQKAKKDPEYLRASLTFRPAIPNATAMLRMDMIRENNIWYNEELPIAEDYDFILRCSRYFPMTNLQETLYKYRASETSIMDQFEGKEERSFEIHKVAYLEALKGLGITPDENNLQNHRMISSRKLFDNLEELGEAYEWLLTIKKQNKSVGTFDEKVLNEVLAERFFFICKKASKLGLPTFIFYLKNGLNSFGLVGPYPMLKFLARCMIKYNKF